MIVSTATLIPIASAIFAAIAGILARVLLKGIPTKKILSVNFFIIGATLLIFSPTFYKFVLSGKSILLLLSIAIIDTLGNYFYFKVFEQTEASTAIPILSLAPVVTFLSGAIFLNEHPKPLTVLLCLIVVALVITISTDWKERKRFSSATLYPALISALLFGVSAIPTKYLLTNLAATNAPTLYMLRAGLIAIFALFLFRDSWSKLDIKTYRFIFLRSLFVIGQWLLLYYALTLGSSGVAVTLGNITPVFVLFLGTIFLGERFGWKKVLAALAILAISLSI